METAPSCLAIGRRYIVNNRWQFVVEQNQFVDLEDSACVVSMDRIVARVLVVFLQSPNTIISRRELLHEGWQRYGLKVSENRLSQVIHTLRGTFQTLDRTQRTFIKTIPRLGYCLIGKVQRTPREDDLGEAV